jgi:hypothetical protein
MHEWSRIYVERDKDGKSNNSVRYKFLPNRVQIIHKLAFDDLITYEMEVLLCR